MRRIIIAVLAVSIAVLVTGCGTAVPDVKGQSVEPAMAALTNAGFRVGAVTYDEKATATTGTVVSQQPEAGARVESGVTVTLTLAGPPPVKTPDLTALKKDAAVTVLKAIGLSMGAVAESYDETIAAGAVTGQDPAAGVEVSKGEAVKVTISKGRHPLPVPKVTGKTQAQATVLLQAAGFKVKVVSAANAAKKGVVFAQKPDGGEAAPSAVITISVSTGATP